MKIGIIGLGNIARRFATSVNLFSTNEVELEIVASRNLEKASAFAKEFNAKNYTNDYYEVLKDPSVDVVYIALPHSHHAFWVKECVKYQKNIFCEKPLSISYQSSLELVELVKENNLFMMEALKTFFMPSYQELKRIVHSGIIGEIIRIEANFNWYIANENSYVYDPVEQGALLDVGIYPLSFVMDIIGSEPLKLESNIVKTKEVISYFNATLTFANVTCFIEGALDRSERRFARIVGSKGVIEVDTYYRPTSYFLIKEKKEEYPLPLLKSDMYDEIAEVKDLLNKGLKESNVYPLSYTLMLAKYLELIKNNAKIIEQ